MSLKSKLAIVGFLLGFGSPLGWLFIQFCFQHEHGLYSFSIRQICVERNLYIYLTAATSFFFSIFGYFVGLLMQKIKEKDELYRKMVSVVAHELRTPLTCIKGRIDLALQGTYGNLIPELEIALQKAQQGCEQISELISRYLDLARIEHGESKPHFRRINLIKDVISPVIEEIRDFSESYKISLDFKNFTNSNPPLILGDIQWLKIALKNLLSNGIKYGYQGTVLEIRLSESPNEFQLEILNQGIGVPIKYQKEIFEKFQSVPYHNKEYKKGTGLGLYIVEEILDQHEGKIRCESEVGKWANFIVTLPKKRS